MSPVVATFASLALFAAPGMLTAREGAGSVDGGRGPHPPLRLALMAQ